VYLPLGIVTALLAVVVFYLLILALFPPTEETLLFLSGLADFVLIMWLLPVVIVFGLALVGGIGGYVYYNFIMDEAERPLPPAPPYGRIRTLLWRVDDIFIRLQPKLLQVENSLARPVIRFNAWLAYVVAWFNSIKKS